ncbi:precorrin-6y C5,15-methyltransferase (decarboxylating) subunit CbiE [Dehalococcoides mccartyi]|jgi:iron complex transport system substrate-binding protein|uniref:Cobalamin-binding protein n=2 Tax=Dehalococcoides mccartyi TaxID=61435 RepID=A0A142V8U8_9CHLR|nr:precorrin-6y C5,15-methyltransferase (decarboxylating) subunit CbiE [Dehalococcoides mccartyi]AII60435.1 precorrin methylase [Dehalococcoides mccartyi CG5]AMU86079.1 cobalamin-binding protein [Dehalococcoides mccartyi]MBA2084646.1 Vitamin B12 ABC transporter, substrate-binding protein BtuF [Dehalococcoides mccartyi]QBX63420.1 precorrin-6y C5,15-methyltransferase (decarboxylating) subunit CbiE [Dehalococcoides mccartyi]BCT55479.1 vitamin B12 ABC transporter, substrate-binding protein BtuF [D
MKLDSNQTGCQITDQAGRRINLKTMPKRIISLAPSLTEIVYAMGADNLLCGVTEYCDYPPEARNKPWVGGYSTVDIGQIGKIQPDLILTGQIHLKAVIPQLEALGYPVLVLEPSTIEGLLATIRIIGKCTGRQEAAEDLVRSLQRRAGFVTAKIGLLPTESRPKVYILHECETWKTFGSETIGDTLVHLAGGYNIGRDFGSYYPYPTKEAIKLKNPEIIIAETGYGDNPQEPLSVALNEPALAQVTARQTGQVFGIHSDLVSRAGPRMVDGLECLACLIHPELFPQKPSACRGKVYIAGVGPGSAEWVSPQVQNLVAKADILVGWEQDLKPVRSLIKNQKIFLQEACNYLEIPKQAAAEAQKNGGTVVVLKTGDPLVAPAGIHGIANTFGGFEMEVVPGISSVQMAAAKACLSLYDAAVITYHPLPHDGGKDLRKKRKRMLSALSWGLHLIVLTGVRQMPDDTALYLLGKGIAADSSVLICENLTYPNEKITACSLSEVAQRKFDWLSVMVIFNRYTSH